VTIGTLKEALITPTLLRCSGARDIVCFLSEYLHTWRWIADVNILKAKQGSQLVLLAIRHHYVNI
jgi:hypothetical protein